MTGVGLLTTVPGASGWSEATDDVEFERVGVGGRLKLCEAIPGDGMIVEDDGCFR